MEHDWPAAIIFDFDGVIVDSEPLHFRAFAAVATEEKLHLDQATYYEQLIGFDDRGAWQHLYALRHRPLDRATFERILNRKAQVVREMMQRGEYEALPGGNDTIRALAKNYPLAICSGALRHEIETMLDGIRLRECFPIIVAAEDVHIGKPDPSGYLLALRLIGKRIGKTLSPADALIVEDAPSVIASVKRAGFRSLGVTTSHDRTDLTAADWIVDSLEADVLHRVLPALRLGSPAGPA